MHFTVPNILTLTRLIAVPLVGLLLILDLGNFGALQFGDHAVEIDLRIISVIMVSDAC